MKMLRRTVRATLTLPRDLLRAADDAVRQGHARSRNEFVAIALRHELAARRRAAIDAAFAGMASDPEAQNEALTVAEEFAAADWEAFQKAEPMP
jgi:metal-responsive CopG/Arc/MetJ family transcriptional regulator